MSVREFNELERLLLMHTSYCLAVPSDAWATWLGRLHALQSSTPYIRPPLAPIGSMPLPDNHLFMANTIARLAASSLPLANGSLSEPFFLGKAERVKAREEEIEAYTDLFEEDIDLDEDGPLKEEYLPKGIREERERRQQREIELQALRKARVEALEQARLPPPSEWSPENDPVIERTAKRSSNVPIGPPAIPAFSQPAAVARSQIPSAVAAADAHSLTSRFPSLYPDLEMHGRLSKASAPPAMHARQEQNQPAARHQQNLPAARQQPMDQTRHIAADHQFPKYATPDESVPSAPYQRNRTLSAVSVRQSRDARWSTLR